jgi:hypothetical protein
MKRGKSELMLPYNGNSNLSFDQLLDDERFRCVEKVKTISSTYMAAAGLNPRDQVIYSHDSVSRLPAFDQGIRRKTDSIFWPITLHLN